MDAGFTKGPWEVERDDLSYPFEGAVFWVTAPDAREGIWNDSGECSEANARLIAAAPDLYEALERVLLDIEFMWEDGTLPDRREDIIYQGARAALLKVQGDAK